MQTTMHPGNQSGADLKRTRGIAFFFLSRNTWPFVKNAWIVKTCVFQKSYVSIANTSVYWSNIRTSVASVIFRWSKVGSWELQLKRATPDFILPIHFVQLLLGDPVAFPSQPGDSLSSVTWVILRAFLLVGHVWNIPPGRRPGGILRRFWTFCWTWPLKYR